jgi:hypothetical protein
MDNNKKYLNIPVPMLKYLHSDSKKFFNDVFDVGIYGYSKTLSGPEEKRYKDALKFFGITQGYIPGAIKNAKDVLSGMPSKYPLTGIDMEMLFDYYENYKTEFELVCLSAFLAIRSVIGKKPYDKTNNAMIRSRMWGFVSPKEMPSNLTPLQIKYQARRQFKKVIDELEINWHLKTLWNHNRGFYVSFDLSYDQMALIIEKSKQEVKLQQLKEAKKKAIEGAKLNV